MSDLGERVGAGQTALRRQVDNLRRLGALEHHVRSGLPYTVENELTDAGRCILAVAETVEAWLTRAPQGAIALGGESAKRAIRALVGGWSSTMLQALAAQPRSLTELSSAIDDLSYPALERRLSAMRAVGLVEPRPNGRRGAKPFAVTEWMRQAVGPLVAAGRCECEHLPAATSSPTGTDIVAAFLLAVPLVNIEVTRMGSCLLAAETSAAKAGDLSPGGMSGVRVDVEEGSVVFCAPCLECDVDAWAVGTASAWAEAILEGRFDELRIGGKDLALAKALVAGLRASLLS